VSSASSRTSSVMRLRRSSYSLASSSVMPRDVALALLVCKSLDLFPQPADDIETIGVVGHKLPAALKCALN
jgi:hypothetical protein